MLRALREPETWFFLILGWGCTAALLHAGPPPDALDRLIWFVFAWSGPFVTLLTLTPFGEVVGDYMDRQADSDSRRRR